MPAWKFFIATFGCKVNQYESQSLREAWQKLGGEECDVPGEADVLCVNSCAITAKGERDARNAVFRLRREAPAARLILTGCAARLFTEFRPEARGETLFRVNVYDRDAHVSLSLFSKSYKVLPARAGTGAP